MKKPYYLFNPGRLSRKDNTLKFTPVDEEGNEGQPRYLPVEGVESFYVFGSLDANSALYNFLGKNRISLHFFDYYEHYTGSFMPKEYLLAGKMQVLQTKAYLDPEKRLGLARKFVEGAAENILKNLRYYENRGRPLEGYISEVARHKEKLALAPAVPELMGLEGNIRQVYYAAFEEIITGFSMGGRSKQPPKNEVNALISFGNMMCYAMCLGQIYHTQLNPTISFLHEPGSRRYSLALDLAEVFKPILVDRLIFKVLNKRILQAGDFEQRVGGITIKKKGKERFVKEWELRLKETIKQRSLGRSVSYKHLVKLECYKLSKDLLGMENYRPFKAWW